MFNKYILPSYGFYYHTMLTGHCTTVLLNYILPVFSFYLMQIIHLKDISTFETSVESFIM